jgi:hypothetical protein
MNQILICYLHPKYLNFATFSPQGHSVAGRIRSIEKSNDLTRTQTHDLPSCSIVPQPTTLPHAPMMKVLKICLIIILNKCVIVLYFSINVWYLYHYHKCEWFTLWLSVGLLHFSHADGENMLEVVHPVLSAFTAINISNRILHSSTCFFFHNLSSPSVNLNI